MKICYHGNCQLSALKKYLEIALPNSIVHTVLPENYKLIAGNQLIDLKRFDHLKDCDVLICHLLSEKHQDFSPFSLLSNFGKYFLALFGKEVFDALIYL